MPKSKLKICFITSAFPSFACGVGDHVARLAEKLLKLDLDIYVITSEQIKIDPYYKKLGIKIYPMIKKWDFSGWKKAYQKVKDTRADLVHFEYPTRYPAGRSQILRFLPHTLPFAWISWTNHWIPKRVITIHEYYKNPILAKVKVILDVWLSHKIILVNQADVNRLRKFSLNPQKIQFMPVGPNTVTKPKNPKRIQEIRWQFKIQSATILLGFFGFIDPSRGFIELLDSIQALKKAQIKLKLLIIGGVKDPEYEKILKQKILSTGLEQQIIWAGFFSNQDSPDYIQALDLAIQPFAAGATSNRSSLIASITLGVPTISTYVKGITPKEFMHKKNLILIPPNSTSALTKAIKLFIDRPELKNILSAGMKQLAKIFNWDESARITKEIYESLL